MIRSFAIILFWAALLAMAGSCGPGLEEGAIPIIEDTDTPTEDPDPVFCPGEIESTCSNINAFEPPEPVITVDDMTLATSFVDMSFNTIAARGLPPDNDPVLAMFTFGGEETPPPVNYALFPVDSPRPSVPIGVVSSLGTIATTPYTRLALIETPDATVLYGANYDALVPEAYLAEIPGSALPSQTGNRGLIYLGNLGVSSPSYDKVCTYGDGMLCWNGTSWTEEIPAGVLQINDLTNVQQSGINRLIAVGDEGKILAKLDEGWTPLDSPTNEDIFTISARGSRFAAAGAVGVFIEGSIDDLDACTAGDEDIFALDFRSGPSSDYFIGLDGAGALYFGFLEQGVDGWICHTGDVYEATIKARYVDGNYFILSPTALTGQISGGSIIID